MRCQGLLEHLSSLFHMHQQLGNYGINHPQGQWLKLRTSLPVAGSWPSCRSLGVVCCCYYFCCDANPLLKFLSVIVFGILLQHKNQMVNEELWNEARTYRDVQLMPFVDYYSLITWKAVAICIFGVKFCISLTRRVLGLPQCHWPHLLDRLKWRPQSMSWKQMMIHLFAWMKYWLLWSG